MKRNYLLFVALFAFFIFNLKINNVFAQVPEGLNYQAVARDASGNLIKNQNINARLSIISGNPSGTIQWQETHYLSTNNFGLFTLVIGTGVSTGIGASTSFAMVNWASDTF